MAYGLKIPMIDFDFRIRLHKVGQGGYPINSLSVYLLIKKEIFQGYHRFLISFETLTTLDAPTILPAKLDKSNSR